MQPLPSMQRVGSLHTPCHPSSSPRCLQHSATARGATRPLTRLQAYSSYHDRENEDSQGSSWSSTNRRASNNGYNPYTNSSSSSNNRTGQRDSASPKDKFASFRAFQQQAALQSYVRVTASGSSMDEWDEEQPVVRRAILPRLKQEWFSRGGLTVQQLYDMILKRAAKHQCDEDSLVMLMRKSQTPEDARTALGAIAVVRTQMARKGQLRPWHARLCAMFVQMCVDCDTPEVLADGLERSTELGLLLTYRSIHGAIEHWGAALELHKMDKVLSAMPRGGLPPTTRSAYMIIRSAVNAGRLDQAEEYARQMQASGIRLRNGTLQLLETARLRSQARTRAVASEQRASAADESDSDDSSNS